MAERTGLAAKIAAALVLTVVLSTCSPSPPHNDITRTTAEGGQLVDGTRLVTEVSEVIIDPTPTAPNAHTDPDPTTFIRLTAADIETLDPALAYDPASADALQNIYEGLITFDRSDSNSFVPVLAQAVPDDANGLISADGLTYTFPIRRGVTFHNGGTLEPHDVAYSIRRELLQSDPTGPAWLFLEPILGVSDITEEIAGGAYVGDPDGLRANVTAQDLAAICARVFAAVTFDDEKGRVAITLAQPWGPFMATMPWLSVIDQEWAAANGAWDGSCNTWADHYAPGPGGSTLNAAANGTGPYRLESRQTGQGYVLTAFEDFRPGNGQSSPAHIPTVIVDVMPEWETRFAALMNGDADYAAVPFDFESQVDLQVGELCDYLTGHCEPNPANPGGLLRKWDSLPTVSRQDIFLNQAVAPDSPYLGRGQLDGNGIPPDFFADLNARRAMANCFDYDTYNVEVLDSEGIRNNGPVITGMLGYNPDGPLHTYDSEACAANLAAAWGGVLPETGFRLQFVYPAALPGGAQAGAVLQNELATINEKYVVDLVGLPPSAFFPGVFAGQFPLFYSGWIEDIHDPHNWAAPYTVGTYGMNLGMPDELQTRFASLVNSAAVATDPATREGIYFELQQLFYDTVPAVILFQRPSFRVEPRYVDGFAFRLGMDVDSPPYNSLSTGP